MAFLEVVDVGHLTAPLHMRMRRRFLSFALPYFYLWDAEWGGTFWKTNAYAPDPIWWWLNGHEWAKRQLEKAGIA